jgi:Domain of unknown function (DUF6438)
VRSHLLLLLAIVAVGASEPGLAAAKPVRAGLAIRYETSACYGTCPHYIVEIRQNGRGTFIGLHFTAVNGARGFLATPAQVRAFTRILEPYRNAHGGQPGTDACQIVHTDDISVTVSWGKKPAFRHYFGCDGPAFEKMEADLRTAPKLLPISDMVGDPTLRWRPLKPGK